MFTCRYLLLIFVLIPTFFGILFVFRWLLQLDYGDLQYRNAPERCLSLLDAVYRSGKKAVTLLRPPATHCRLMQQLRNLISFGEFRHRMKEIDAINCCHCF